MLTLLTNETASVRVKGMIMLYLFTVINITTIPDVNKIISVISQRHTNNIINYKISGETERNGVWFPEDGDSCCKTGQIIYKI